jgi:hypothetical protein
MTRLAFLAELSGARRGDRVTYHTGSLMTDRKVGSLCLQVSAVAAAAWEAYETGRCMLVQQRVGPLAFNYIAVKL